MSTKISAQNNAWDDVAEAVADGDGVATFTAGELRTALGAGRLTPWVNQQILDALHSRGMATVPATADELPTYQHHEVRVYDATSPIGKIISAAIKPGTEADERLRSTIDNDASEILNQIRVMIL